jgi:hypothetical protein
MPVTKTLSNEFMFEFGRGAVSFDDEYAVFRLILLDDEFVFNRTTHDRYSDVSANELPTEHGYTQGGVVLETSAAWARDDVNHKASIAWENLSLEASEGAVGPSAAAIVLVYDQASPGDSLVVGCIDFGTTITIPDGLILQLQNLGFDLFQGE